MSEELENDFEDEFEDDDIEEDDDTEDDKSLNSQPERVGKFPKSTIGL
jgi:hypothetical protein